ncbi:MAG: zinc dependent phospholipase C family protein [Candidatus Aenigmatarchaeota archaeon]
MMKYYLKFLILLSFMLPIVNAWGRETHVWICNQIYSGNEALREVIKNKTLFLEGCIAPDTIVKDQRQHSCYYAKQCKKIDTTIKAPGSLHYFADISECFDGDYFYCPALEKFNETIKMDDYSIGMAIHYFSDALTPTHQITGEDYFSCHKPFEDKIDSFVGKKGWKISQKCSFSFPCNVVKKTIRKCDDVYFESIDFSYEDLIKVVVATDKEISSRLGFEEGKYEHLFRRTGLFYQILQKIQDLIAKIKQDFPFQNIFS